MSWNRPSSVPYPPPKKSAPPSLRRGLLAGLVVVALGALGLWFFSGGETRQGTASTKGRGLIREVAPAPVPKADTNAPVKAVEKLDPSKVHVKTLSCVTNSGTGRICEIYVDGNGDRHRWYRPARPPMFKYRTDVMLSLLLNQKQTHSPPPLPPTASTADLDAEFRRSLKEPIEIGPDDSEMDAEKKRVVIEAREQVSRMMKEGRHFQEILDEARASFEEGVVLRNKAQRELNEIHAKGDLEGERKYMEGINEAFAGMGIQELDQPMTKEEKAAARQAVREQLDAKRMKREERK